MMKGLAILKKFIFRSIKYFIANFLMMLLLVLFGFSLGRAYSDPADLMAGRLVLFTTRTTYHNYLFPLLTFVSLLIINTVVTIVELLDNVSFENQVKKKIILSRMEDDIA